MRTTTSLLQVLLVVSGPVSLAAIAPGEAVSHDADSNAAAEGTPSAGDSTVEQIQVVGADGAPLTLDKGMMLQLLELMKANKPDSNEVSSAQLSKQTQTVFKKTISPLQQQSTVYPWQALATARERLVDHFRHGLDPGTATFIFLENHARSLAGLPWGEAGVVDAERILARVTHFVESLPSHSMLAIEGRYQLAVLRGLTYAPNIDAHSVFLEAEANHISSILAAANSTAAASKVATGLDNNVEDFSGLYTAIETLESLNGRLRWLFSLMQRRDDTLGLTFELCARFALSDSTELINHNGIENPPIAQHNNSASTNSSFTSERARLVVMAEGLVKQATVRSRKHESRKKNARKKAKEKECIDNCAFQWPEKRSAQQLACFNDCKEGVVNVSDQEDSSSERKSSSSSSTTLPFGQSGGLLDHIDAKHVVRTMMRALRGGDAWVATERRRIESILQADTASSTDSVPAKVIIEANQAASANETKASMQAMSNYLGAAPGQLGRARALSFVLFALDRCRITTPEWSGAQPNKKWRFEWCHRHSVNQWAVGDSYVAEDGEPAYSLGQFVPSSSSKDSLRGNLGESFDVASAVSMLADSGPGRPESLAYGRQRFVNGSMDDCIGNVDTPEASTKRMRASEVHLVCCSGLGGVRFPEGMGLAQTLRVRHVVESSAQPCRYRIDVCSPFACRNYAFSPWFDAVANPIRQDHNKQQHSSSSQTAEEVEHIAYSQESSEYPRASFNIASTAAPAYPEKVKDLSVNELNTYWEDVGVTSESRRWPDVSHNLVDTLSPAIGLPSKGAVKSREVYELARCPPGSICRNTSSSSSSSSRSKGSSTYCSNSKNGIVSSSKEAEAVKTRRLALRERARALVRVAYGDYMAHAYPMAELLPLTCRGGDFILVNISLVTLVDALDTLAVIGDAQEFRRAVGSVVSHFTAPRTGGGGGRRKGVGGRGPFDFDVAVSVFETNIRLLGGLLSAHLLAEHPEWWDPHQGSTGGFGPQGEAYDGALLDLAIDLGERLLPAFNTPTGIPVGSINLRRGVHPDETSVASLAGAGSLALEMQMLSHLSGDARFGCAARGALIALFVRRSHRTGLLGKHIDVVSGAFTEENAGIGSTADSFYEYLAKMAWLFGDQACWHMFSACATAVEAWNKFGDWYGDVEANHGTPTRPMSDALQGFWPGMLAQLGDVSSAARSLNAFLSVAESYGAPGAPEEFDFLRSALPSKEASNGRAWLLRPELLESAMHLRQAAKGRDDKAADSWLTAGEAALEALERVSYVNQRHQGKDMKKQAKEPLGNPKMGCGFAAVNDVSTLELEDAMPSYFLAETLKYVFLLFDDENWSHGKRDSESSSSSNDREVPPFVWTTEGHVLPILPAAQVDSTPGGTECSGFHGIMRGRHEPQPVAAKKAGPPSKVDDKTVSSKRGLLETLGGVFRPNKDSGSDKSKKNRKGKSMEDDDETTSSPPSPPSGPAMENEEDFDEEDDDESWVFVWPFLDDGDGLPRSCPNPDWFTQFSTVPKRNPPGSGLYSPAMAREGPWASPRFLPDALLLTTE